MHRMDYGILSGNRILKEIENGKISIDPFDKKRMNPNSYNVRLADEIVSYVNDTLDMKQNHPCFHEKIPANGYLLIPERVYLARTMERCRTDDFVPMIEGRSSVGRLGLFVHATAGFGDNGFEGYWTLELSCVQPIYIYAGIEIAQIYFHTIADVAEDERDPDIPIKYTNGKYQNNHSIQSSMLWKDFVGNDG